MNKLTGKPYRSFGGICSYTNDFARLAETCQAPGARKTLLPVKNAKRPGAPVHKPGNGLRQSTVRLHVCMQTVSSRKV
jgi:hypothetical protein